MDKFCTLSLFATSILLLAQTIHSSLPWFPVNFQSPYILQGFDVQQVAQLKNGKETWDKCWDEPNVYQVCLTRTLTEDYLTWSNKSIQFKVNMKKYKSGSISQSWLFKDFGISLFRGVKGNITQSWELPNTTWEYYKSADGKVSQEWKGEEDMKAVEHYKSFINSWCAVNDFYIGKENCVIY